MDVVDIIRTIFQGLMFIGATASTIFVFDYLRTADLRSYYTRMLIVLNGAIAGVLWTSIVHNYTEANVWSSIFMLVMFALVDVALIAQIVLLNKARKRVIDQENGHPPGPDDNVESEDY